MKRAALLHDLGKAVTHEVEGSHALIGAEIARRFDEDPAVVHGIEAHHNEVEPRTVPYRAGEIGPPAAMFLDADIAWREFGIIEWRVA